MKIVVLLPPNRNLTGVLRVENDRGKVIAGPFPVAGRAADGAAARRGNPARSPLLRCGDTPVGVYRLVKTVRTGPGTVYPTEAFGAEGAGALQGTAGDAALAEANGRSHVLIQGGPLGAEGRLRAANGALRLADRHLRAVLRVLGDRTDVRCEVAVGSTTGDIHQVDFSEDYDEGDPPLRPEVSRARMTTPHLQRDSPYSRRQFLHAATVTAAGMALGSPLFVSKARADVMGTHYGFEPAPPASSPANENTPDEPSGPVDVKGPEPAGDTGGQVDWEFIGDHEGTRPDAYVPKDKSGNVIDDSGVTIASGIDVGQMDKDEFNSLVNGLSVSDKDKKAIKDTLTPFVGLTGDDAASALSKASNIQPLTDGQIQALDQAVRAKDLNRVTNAYNTASSSADFTDLPSEAQTVISSVAFQYGDLSKRAPKFWKDVTAQDWQSAIKELRNFGDKYKTRRNDEADLLQEMMDKQNQNKLVLP